MDPPFTFSLLFPSSPPIRHPLSLSLSTLPWVRLLLSLPSVSLINQTEPEDEINNHSATRVPRFSSHARGVAIIAQHPSSPLINACGVSSGTTIRTVLFSRKSPLLFWVFIFIFYIFFWRLPGHDQEEPCAVSTSPMVLRSKSLMTGASFFMLSS